MGTTLTSVVLCMQSNLIFASELQVSVGPRLHPVDLWMQNCELLDPEWQVVYLSQPSSCWFSEFKTACFSIQNDACLYGSQAFICGFSAFKTAALEPELQVSMRPLALIYCFVNSLQWH